MPDQSEIALALLDNAGDGYAALDRDFRVVYANATAARLLGAEPEPALRETERFDAASQKWYEVSASPAPDGGLAVRFRDVTRRKEAEAALHQSKELAGQRLQEIEEIYQNAPVGLCVLDRELRYVRINGRLAELNGVAAAAHIGRTIRDVLPHLADFAEPRMRCVLETGRPQLNLEIEGETAAQPGVARKWVEHWLPIRDAAGKVIGLNMVVEEVTEQRRAEEALRQSREQLKLITDAVPALIAQLDREARFLLANGTLERWFGVPSSQAPGRHVREVFGEAAWERMGPHIARALGGQDVSFEERLPSRGGPRWVRFDCTPEGVLLAQDIGASKRSEEQIRHQNAVLAGITRIFRQALDCATEQELGCACLEVAEEATQSRFGFLGELNAEGRLDYIAISDLGWDACRMHGAVDRKLPAGLAVHGICGRVIQAGKGFFTNDPQSDPDRAGLPDGQPGLTAFLGVPLVHGGTTIGMIGLANRAGGYRTEDLEIMESLAVAVVQVLMRRRAEQAVHASEERLRQAQKLESIAVLAGGVAHDFNNLLTSVLGNASLAQLEAPSELREYLDRIVEASENAAGLTRQLLAYAGKGQFEISDFGVAQILQSACDLLRVSIPRDVEIALDVPADLPYIRGDSAQIQQIVMNLVINAAEAIGNQRPARISIGAGVRLGGPGAPAPAGLELARGRYVWFQIRDNGCGMDDATRAKIFDPFFTTKFTGRGLGLAAVQGILRAHKGGIAVESKPGAGSAFRVYLPCAPARRREAGIANGLAARGRRARILVVDDERAIRLLAREALERHGHAVLLAEDGRQALELLSSDTAVDLVLLDIFMPVLGGGDALAEIRRRWPDLPVLVTSGYGREEADRLVSLRPDSPFVEKPFTAQRLAEAVQAALEP